MKKFKAILALVLVAALFVTLFAACAKTEEKPNTDTNTNTNTENNTNTNTDTNTNTGSDDKESAGDDEAGEPVVESPFDPEDPTTVEFYICDTFGKGMDHEERLAAAMNEILEPMGIHLVPHFMQIGQWVGTMQTSIAGGQRIDLMTYCIANTLSALQLNGMALDIEDVLTEYAPEAMELMAPYSDTYRIDGVLYGLPTYRSYITNGYICFNQNILEEYNLVEQAKAMDSWSDLEAILATMHAGMKGTGMYPISGGISTLLYSNTAWLHGDNFSDIEVVDTVGDGLNVVYVDPNGQVSLSVTRDAYLEAVKLTKDWYDKGYVFPDGIHDSALSAQNTIAAGGAASEICTSELGIDSTKTGVYGAPALCIQYYTGLVNTSALTSWGIGVPITCEEPEAAAFVINQLYTNADLMRIFGNGIEGEDYTVVDGQAQMVENMYSFGNYVLGNNCLSLPLLGNGADFYEKIDAMNKSAEPSPYLGFNLDKAGLDLVISQITAVNDQYRTSLQSGGFDEGVYQEFLTKLEAAGVQEYLDAVQTQLDAFAK